MKKLYPLLILLSCGQTETAKEVISRHKSAIGAIDGIENLITLAQCHGPDGKYTTHTESSFTDDYLLFKQDYSYKPNPFYALIHEKNEGYGLDTLMNSQGALSEPVIAILKAHEFHELALQVDNRYFNMTPGADTSFFGTQCRRVLTTDHLNYPVTLFFNKKTGLMEGLSQANPYKKGEVIRVHFEDWKQHEELHLFERVMVLQGTKAQYRFDFSRIRINDPTFTKMTID